MLQAVQDWESKNESWSFREDKYVNTKGNKYVNIQGKLSIQCSNCCFTDTNRNTASHSLDSCPRSGILSSILAAFTMTCCKVGHGPQRISKNDDVGRKTDLFGTIKEAM